MADDDDDHVNDVALVVKLSGVLLSPECQRLNFRWGRQHITGHGFRIVVLALADSRINLFEADDAAHKLDDDVEASYYGRTETMTIQPHLDLQRLSNRRTIVHEATHAIQDVQLAGKWIRNAGGRATDDAIRSLIISHKLLGTAEWFVIHHTNCGMELFADEVIADLLEDDLGTAAFDGKKWSNPHHHGGHAAGHFIKWHTFSHNENSVTLDVRRIREHPLVPKTIPIYGFIYDVRTGRLNEVKAATAAGKAAA